MKRVTLLTFFSFLCNFSGLIYPMGHPKDAPVDIPEIIRLDRISDAAPDQAPVPDLTVQPEASAQAATNGVNNWQANFNPADFGLDEHNPAPAENNQGQPAARRPEAQGPFYRAVPQPQRLNSWLLYPACAAVIGAFGYGFYKFYLYWIAPTPHKLKDIKRALIDLHREVIRAKKLFEEEAYEPGTLKAYFDAQLEIGSFASLTLTARKNLSECIEHYEAALSNFGPIERAYAVTRRCISGLLQQVNATTKA